MSRSILLQLARDSIAEVIEAKRTIDKNALLNTYPLLKEKIPTTINLYLDDKLRGSYTSDASSSLFEAIVKNAKCCAFEDANFTPITTSEYLSCEVEIILQTPDGVISERDPSLLSTHTFNEN